MTAKRNVEMFCAGCPPYDATVALVRDLACPIPRGLTDMEADPDGAEGKDQPSR